MTLLQNSFHEIIIKSDHKCVLNVSPKSTRASIVAKGATDFTDDRLPQTLSSQDAVSGSAQKRLDKSTVDRAADSDVESVAADADVATVFAFAAAVVLSAAETSLEPVVAEADGDHTRLRLRPTFKSIPKPKPETDHVVSRPANTRKLNL